MFRANAARSRGSVRQRGGSLQIRLFSGVDPVTGNDIYLTASIKGTDKAAQRKAKDKLAEFRTQVINQRSASTSVTLGYALDEWLRVTEIEESTRKTYVGYIERTIKPALGDVPLKKIDARTLESFYTELRRCRTRCNGKPHVDRHTSTAPHHDCRQSGCKAHHCRPMPASTVRQIHTILSGALGAAERWDWIATNPARIARRPKQKPPEPDPPTPREGARLVEEAFHMDDDWGTLVWLAMTTDMRRDAFPVGTLTMRQSGGWPKAYLRHIDNVAQYQNNWDLIRDQLTKEHVSIDTPREMSTSPH